MTRKNERWPPRLAAWVVYITFDRDSRKADYVSFVDEYRDRGRHKRNHRKAKAWAYWTAARNVGGLVPPSIRTAVVAAILKWILRV